MVIRFARLFAILFLCAFSSSPHAASPFAGFYVGVMHTSISGNVTLPERPIGPVAFTVTSDGVISSSGDLTGTVTDAGVILPGTRTPAARANPTRWPGDSAS